jgi:large subunit ribosomal protein LX
MSEVKIFRIVGRISKPNYKTDFRKEIRALKPEDAVEKVYKEIGSKHRVKRVQIRILKIDEMKPEDATDPIVRKLSQGEEESAK